MDEWLPLQMALALLRASLGFRQPSVSGYTFALSVNALWALRAGRWGCDVGQWASVGAL